MLNINIDGFGFIYTVVSFLVKTPVYLGWLSKNHHIEVSFLSSTILTSIILKLESCRTLQGAYLNL